jgi:hypothetical protein
MKAKTSSKRTQILAVILSIQTLVCLVLVILLLTNRTDRDIKSALDSCIDEVSSKCKGLYKYATSLEAENARLNKIISKRK